MVGVADRERRPGRAAIDAVTASWTIESEDDGRCKPRQRGGRAYLIRRSVLAWAARPRERAIKAERGAGSAAAVPRSGAALDLSTGEFGNADVAGRIAT